MGPPPNGTSIGEILAWVSTVPNVAYCVSIENSLKFPLSAQNGQFWAGEFFFLAFGQICQTFGLPKHQTLISAQNGPIWADRGSHSDICRYAVKMKSDAKKMCRLDL